MRTTVRAGITWRRGIGGWYAGTNDPPALWRAERASSGRWSLKRRGAAGLVEYSQGRTLRAIAGTIQPTWETFTRRTNDPKLAWLERQLKSRGILNRRNGESWHAPILEVPESQLDDSWAVLTPALDNLPDNARRFVRGAR